jgi:cytochrome c-type biogenesis protein CcmH
MSGWVSLLALAVLTLGGLIIIGRLPRALWQAAAAVIVLAMTGYALQGRPSIPAAPAKAVEAQRGMAAQLILMRSDMDQSFGVAKRWLFAADAFSRDGDYKLSAGFIQSGLREYPNNADLWSALGLQLMLASNGQISPPAKLAFDNARKNGPRHPAPDYFQGISVLFDGDVDGAIRNWENALAKATPKAKWRPRLESQLAALKVLKARQAGQPQSPPANN